MMKLYAIPVSVYAAKVRLAAVYKGIELEMETPPDGYGSVAYKAIVPQGSVPALVHDGFVLAESDSIIEYLDEIGAGRPLLPADPRDRARNRELARFMDLRLELAARALYPFVGKPEVPKDLLGRLAANTAMLAPLVTPAPYLTGSAPSLADCALLPVANVLDVMARHLAVDLPLPDWLPAYRRTAYALPEVEAMMTAHAAALEGWAQSKIGSKP